MADVPAAGPEEPSWTARLGALLLPVLRHVIEQEGVAKSGAYNFYEHRIRSGGLFANYELALLRKLLNWQPSLSQVCEIGSGFGQLVFLLGWHGLPAVGFEADGARAHMAERLLQILKLVEPERSSNISLIGGEFPGSSAYSVPSGSLVVTTNIVATRTHEQQLGVIAAMKQFDHVLVDIQRFFDLCPEPEQEKERLAMFAQAGFVHPQLFLDLGRGGKYYLFGKDRMSEASCRGSDATMETAKT